MNIIESIINYAASALELAGIGVITLGALVSTLSALKKYVKKEKDVYSDYRRKLSRAILLGLEFLVAADIIKTVAVEPSFTSVGVLALIVLIRTFLSFALEVEVTGKLPWQQGEGDPVKH
jgi:uncharacterized membrane protein